METQHSRYTFYNDIDCILEYEIWEDSVVLHSEIANWKPSVFKRCLSVLNTFFKEMEGRGIRRALTVTPNPKFAKLFGGITVSKIKHDDKEYEVVVWDLK